MTGFSVEDLVVDVGYWFKASTEMGQEGGHMSSNVDHLYVLPMEAIHLSDRLQLQLFMVLHIHI